MEKRCVFISLLLYGSTDMTLFTDLYVKELKVRSIISYSVRMGFDTDDPGKVGF